MGDVERAAYHESGHAVAFALYGNRVRLIRIDEDGGGLTRAWVRRATETPWQTALCVLAGPMSEMHAFGNAEYPRQETDIKRARREADAGGFAVGEAILAAGELVAQCEDDIAAVAAALLRQRFLDEDQFLAVVRSPRGCGFNAAARNAARRTAG